MQTQKTADPAMHAWIASWPIERRTKQVSASKPFYGIPIDLQAMILEYALETHEPDDIVITASILNDAYYIHSAESSMTRKGSRALLEVNALSRELALKKFSGSLLNLPHPRTALYIDPTPVLSTFRFDPVNDVICMAPFHNMAIHIFPGLRDSLPPGHAPALDDDLHLSLYMKAKFEWSTQVQTPGEFEFAQLSAIIPSRLEMYQHQLWRLSNIQNMRLPFEDLEILLSMDTRPTVEQATHKIELIVNFLLSNRSLKKVFIERPHYLARSRRNRRRTKKRDAWLIDVSREDERILQKCAMEKAKKSGTTLTPEELEHVQAKYLTRCILFILDRVGVDS
jgi:hypothetical protein